MNDNARLDGSTALLREITSHARTSSEHLIERMGAFLERRHVFEGRLDTIVVDSAPRSSGASSGLVLFEVHVVGTSGEKQALPLVFRYDLGGAFFFQYDLVPQFHVMRALETVHFPAPRAILLDEYGEVAGRPGLFMHRVLAPPPGGQPLAEGPLAVAPRDLRHAMILNTVRTLAKLHALPIDIFDLSFLNRRGRGSQFIERALEWDSAELLHAIPSGFGEARKTFYDDVRADLLKVHNILLRNAPIHRQPQLAHGDANLSNVMFRGAEVEALLDWELCHLGLGEADLAYCIAGIAHFLFRLPPQSGIPSETEMIEAYRHERGELLDWEFCRLWGEWRLAVYQSIAFSRLPPQMTELEEAYWCHARARLSQSVAL